MSTWYLDNDDEITDAVARLRGTDAETVVFVVPPGSRIATGRINFKLLAREAAARDLRMAVASPDEQVRALAASAGVLAAATPDEAEAALERGDEPDVPAAPTDAGEAGSAVVTASEHGTLSWRSQRMRLVTVTVLVLVLVGGFAVSQVTPTAQITLVPKVTVLPRLETTIVASVGVTEIDVGQGRMPAMAIPVPVEASITQPSTGELVTETKATGSVVFSSRSQDSEQEIGEGTRVRTPAEIEFRTTRTVTLPRSEDGELAQITAPVEALEAGEAGNVGAGRINSAPTLEGQDIGVTNPEATSGGQTRTSPLVTPMDYDDAAENLENLLLGQLKAFVEDPANTPPGMTVFSETRTLGPLTLEPAPEAVIGTPAAEFTLDGSADAWVVAVDETVVDQVLGASLLASVPPGQAVIDRSVEIEHQEGQASGQEVAFSGSAKGRAVTRVDPDAVLDQIAGLPISDAQAILEELGSATVNVWPGFIGDLPEDRQRITLDVEEASTTE